MKFVPASSSERLLRTHEIASILLFGIIFCFQIAAVRTFSMVLAASFWAAVVTWA